jgi:glycosyltransferase involved in cell wall biosynthesis
MPKVSVITPTYNRGDVLARAIQSVREQSLDDIEHIVVDDASEEDIEVVVSQFDDDWLTYLEHETNRGPGPARNTGIEAASGEYVAFLDSDDYWRPAKLERQCGRLDGLSDDWVAIYCDTENQRQSSIKEVLLSIVDTDARVEGDAEVVQRLIYPNSKFAFGATLLARRDAVRSVGGFNESLIRHQDVELGIRLAMSGKIAHLPQPLAVIGESSYPRAADIERSREVLFERYREILGATEYDVERAIASHKFLLARCFFREGDFRTGLAYLREGRPHQVGQYFRLLYSVYLGLAGGIDSE